MTIQWGDMPRLLEFVSSSVNCSGIDPSTIPKDKKVSVALAVVNTVTLFMRSIGILRARDLQEVRLHSKNLFCAVVYTSIQIKDNAGEWP